MKHSPGPWHWEAGPNDSELLGLQAADGPMGIVVANQRTANNRDLIAAAPELLELLRKIEDEQHMTFCVSCNLHAHHSEDCKFAEILDRLK